MQRLIVLSSGTEHLASIDRSLSMSGRMYYITLATDLQRHQRDASSILFPLNTSGLRAMRNEQSSRTLNISFALLPGFLLLLYLTNKSIYTYIYIHIFCVYVQLVVCTMFLICLFLSFSSKSHIFRMDVLIFPFFRSFIYYFKFHNSF